MNKLDGKVFANACASTYEMHNRNGSPNTMDILLQGSLLVLAIDELSYEDFKYFCKLAKIKNQKIAESLLDIGSSFDLLKDYADRVPPNLELLSTLSNMNKKEVKIAVEMLNK